MGPEGITPPEIIEEMAKFELEQNKGSDTTNADTKTPGVIDQSVADDNSPKESVGSRFNDLSFKRQELQDQINTLMYGRSTGFDRDNPRVLTDLETSELEILKNEQGSVEQEFQKVSQELYWLDLQKNPYKNVNEKKANYDSGSEISVYGPAVDDAMLKVRLAEVNGDSDDIAEARANYKSVLKDNLERGRATREHMRDFDDMFRQ
ncbi:MAG: hypothetical protein Q8P30_00525 [Candidatus Uhrbacteria bacterium]|nr:hypothetical protein [Candidatus Uhrbacteria bacterium]